MLYGGLSTDRDGRKLRTVPELLQGLDLLGPLASGTLNPNARHLGCAKLRALGSVLHVVFAHSSALTRHVAADQVAPVSFEPGTLSQERS